MKLAKEVKDTGANVSISLKAGNPDQYKKLTKVDGFSKTLQAISNFAELGDPASVSITTSALVADNLEELVKAATDAGAANVLIEFCATTFENGKPKQGYMLPPDQMAAIIASKYDQLLECSDGKLSIQQSLPFCLYPDGFLEKAGEHIMSGCHVMSRSGVIFTHEGGVLLCNCLHGFELGKLDKDFHNTETFNEFWQRKEVVHANERLVCYPHRRCMDCKEYDKCCGGCPLQWFVFDPKVVLQETENERFDRNVELEDGYVHDAVEAS